MQNLAFSFFSIIACKIIQKTLTYTVELYIIQLYSLTI